VTLDHEPVRSADAGGFEATPSVVTIDEPSGVAAESIRALRTQLVTIHNRDRVAALAVCGPESDVGCTFVAVNLAVALSQIEMKTLLVDANMREPGVQEMILPPVQPAGLQQCLTGEVPPEDAIQHDVLPGLSVLYSGGVAPNPQELLAGGVFRELIERWSREYDLTVIDTPPANQSADGRFIASLVGTAVIVARQNHTSVSDLKTAITELEQSEATVIGTILNQA
jgi:capsular exopolysaccharide synthesis family protein